MSATWPAVTELQVNLKGVPLHDGCKLLNDALDVRIVAGWDDTLQDGSLWLNQEGNADTC